MHRVAARLVLFAFSVVAIASYSLAANSDRVRHNPLKEASQTVLPVATADGERFCSAVVVKPGVALTAKHCYMEDVPAHLEQDGKLKRITEWQLAKDRDLAIVLVDGLDCPCASAAPRDAVKSGEDVLALGFPLGGPQAATYGFVVGRVFIDRTLGIDPGWYIVSTVHIKGGNSGGGLFIVVNSKAYLIGINVAATATGNITFSVDVTQ